MQQLSECTERKSTYISVEDNITLLLLSFQSQNLI